MSQAGTVFRKPNLFEQILNKGFGVLVGLGIGLLRHNFLLQVPGRKTGHLYSTRSICWRSRSSGTLLFIFRRSPFRGRFPPNAIISARADRSAPSLRHSSHYLIRDSL
jgi:hypothetical protein